MKIKIIGSGADLKKNFICHICSLIFELMKLLIFQDETLGRNFEKYVCAPKDISKLKHRLDPLSCSKHCREVRQVDFDELDRIGLKYMNGNLHLENETIFPNVKVMKYINNYETLPNDIRSIQCLRQMFLPVSQLTVKFCVSSCSQEKKYPCP